MKANSSSGGKSSDNHHTRSSLGLFTSDNSNNNSEQMPGSAVNSPQKKEQEVANDAVVSRRRRRQTASRRQSEDTMQAMRSLDRQYGRRRRLNTDYPKRLTEKPSVSSQVSAGGTGKGDSRTLFAPPLLSLPTTSTTTGIDSHNQKQQQQQQQPKPSPLTPGGSARLARQLMLVAGKLSIASISKQGKAQSPSLSSASRALVRPRASMPLINGARRIIPQHQQQKKKKDRQNPDELSDALTMKSVEIRGGRIMLDDPSSSGSCTESEDEEEEEQEAVTTSNRLGYAHRCRRLGSIASTSRITAVATTALSMNSDIDNEDNKDQEEEEEEEMLRRRWYTKRCLGLRQSFGSVHRLAKAEFGNGSPSSATYPLLNDLRKVLDETKAHLLDYEEASPVSVDVLLCTDAIIVCPVASSSPLQTVEFIREALVVRVDGDDQTVVQIQDEEDIDGEDKVSIKLQFATDRQARQWVEQVMQARSQFSSVLQDLRLDEEDYVERPPLSLVIQACRRGRSSIAGSKPAHDMMYSSPLRMRNAAQGGVYWVPDSETRVCMVCRKTAFSMMVRRHHCRSCGLIICYRCSTTSNGRHQRLCTRCHSNADVANPNFAARPSLQSLGRRAAEYLPTNEAVMQQVAASTTNEDDGNEGNDDPAAVLMARHRKINKDGGVAYNHRQRRPISSVFPVAAAASSSTPLDNS